MKKQILPTFIALLSILLNSCGSKLCCLAPAAQDGINAQRDNAEFKTTQQIVGYSSTTSKDTIVVSAPSADGTYLTFKFPASGVQKYTPHANDAFFYILAGKDAASTKYKLDTTAINTLTTVVDGADKTLIMGSFNLTFKEYSPAEIGKTVFSSGNFRVHTKDGYVNPQPY